MASGVAGPLIKIALGKGKQAKAQYALQPLDDIVVALKALPRDISLKYQLRALRKAAKPGMEALRSQVSQVGQVTGNLLASVTKAERKYNNNRAKLPVGVIVVGFRRPNNTKSQKMATPAFAGGSVLKGPNRAYHSHLVEFGTQSRSAGKSRRTGRKRVVLGGRLRTIISREKEKSGARSILSSFSTRGPFAKGTRGQYPKDFIATGTVRGAPAQHPLQSAFNNSRQKMQSVLDTEMRNALEKALRELDKRGGL
jgi:hypothetical protein